MPDLATVAAATPKCRTCGGICFYDYERNAWKCPVHTGIALTGKSLIQERNERLGIPDRPSGAT